MSQEIEFDKFLNSVTNELDNISTNFKQRQQTYKKCLKDYKQHLEREAKQLAQSEEKINHKNQLLRKTYENIYDTINQDSDTMFRLIRKTFKLKTNFWKETIQQFIDSPDLELKRNFYQEKREANQMQEEANAQRKLVKKVPYSRLVSLGEKNKTLQSYQESNRNLQNDVNAGTMLRLTHPDLRVLPTDRFDNKQNTIFNWGNISREKKSVEVDFPLGIINNFMRQ